MHTKFTLAAIFAAVFAIQGCVSSDLERAGVGAAVGAGAAVVLDGNPVTGALIGGAAGALCDDLITIC